MSAAYAIRDDGRWLARRSWVVLLVNFGILVAAVLLVFSGWLVRLDNDHQGRSIEPALVQPGATVSGRLMLSNQGLLPISVTLEPRNPDGTRPLDLPAGLEVTVKRLGDGVVLYHGPFTYEMGPLEVLAPGQSTRLEVSITATDTSGRAAVALPYSYYWNAGPSLPWWWWLPVVLVAAVLTGYIYRRRPGSPS